MGKSRREQQKTRLYTKLVPDLKVYFIVKAMQALAGVAQRIEHMPAKQRVTGLIPSQGTCRPGPQ